MKKYTIFVLGVFLLTCSLFPGSDSAGKKENQSRPAQKTEKIAAGTQYWKKGLHRLFLGKDYRKLWALPIEVEILDMKGEAGGLSPVMTVGGQQTMGLALAGKNGRAYTFRSIDKDPSATLSPLLKGTIADRIVQDQMSSAQPAGPLVAEVLMRAAGILTTPVKLVVLPDDPELGEYREDFAGIFGTFQEYPTEASGEVPGFAGVSEVLNYDTMWERLESNPKDRIDSKAYLKARLLDLIMGDWDRHRKQWRWARLPGKDLWQPIPEDRDQVFCKYDGLLLTIGRFPLPFLLNFKETYPGIYGMTFGGWDVDRYLLTDLEKPEWKEVARDLKANLSDRVIEQAVKCLPPEYYTIEGPRLEGALKNRRDNLMGISNQFYDHLARKVDIYMTKQPEDVKITKSGDDAVNIQITLLSQDGVTPLHEPYYQRTFHGYETQEIRLHLMAGSDRITTQGDPVKGILIRVIGGPDEEKIDDSSWGKIRIYDDKGTPEIKFGKGTKYNNRPYTQPILIAHTPWVPPQEWGKRSVPQLWFGGGPDMGFFLGGGFNTKTYGFRKLPFSTSQTLRAGFASLPGAFRMDYKSEIHLQNTNSYFSFRGLASGIEILRFFGYGNESANTENSAYHRVRQEQYIVEPTFSLFISRSLSFSVGPTFKYSRTKMDEDRIITALQPYGANNYAQLGLWTSFNGTTNEEDDPHTSELRFEFETKYFPALFDVEDPFGLISGNISAHLTASKLAMQPTLALRVGGKHVFGKYPFHEAAFIGGGGLTGANSTVRGFRSQRFAGDSSLFGNAELRLRLSEVYIFVPGEIGVFGLSDIGRVYYEGETSKKWHMGYGGGVWFSFLEHTFTFTAALASSEEELGLYITGGFLF